MKKGNNTYENIFLLKNVRQRYRKLKKQTLAATIIFWFCWNAASPSFYYLWSGHAYSTIKRMRIAAHYTSYNLAEFLPPVPFAVYDDSHSNQHDRNYTDNDNHNVGTENAADLRPDIVLVLRRCCRGLRRCHLGDLGGNCGSNREIIGGLGHERCCRCSDHRNALRKRTGAGANCVACS